MARLRSGRHFLQIPGPTNVPERVLRAIGRPVIDHRGPEFATLSHEVLDGLKEIFKTKQPVIAYPASGTGAWEAALVNTLSPGDRVLMAETGQFAVLWKKLAEKLGLTVDFYRATGVTASTRRRLNIILPMTVATPSRRSASFTMKHRPASPATSRRYDKQSTRHVTRPC